MVKSMTGYGKAEITAGNRKITAEIRSLNGKQLDLSVKLPQAFRVLEYDLRSLAAQTLIRGKADLFINIETAEGEAPAAIDGKLFSSYCRELRSLYAANGIADEAGLAAAVLRLPQVVSTGTDTVTEAEKAAVIEAVKQALVRLDEFRRQEGAVLIADLLRRIGKIGEYRERIVPYETARIETVKKRIRESIEAVGIAVDQNRLEQEMIFYVEKLDITEEKVRLENHCRYFEEVAEGEEGVGRKLGFIAQEIGREINTLGSKANDSDIQRIVVMMKDELEKIKEQVLNIL